MISQITEQVLDILSEYTNLSTLNTREGTLHLLSSSVLQTRSLVNLAKELINIIRIKKQQIKALKTDKAILKEQNESLQMRLAELERNLEESQELLTKAQIDNRKLKASEREKGKSYDRVMLVGAQLNACQAVFDSQSERIKKLEAKIGRSPARGLRAKFLGKLLPR